MTWSSATDPTRTCERETRSRQFFMAQGDQRCWLRGLRYVGPPRTEHEPPHVPQAGTGVPECASTRSPAAADAVVTLARGKRPVYSVYVRKNKKYKVTGVNDGTYKVFYSTGVDWDAGAKSFRLVLRWLRGSP
jgi:hypothetical protein